MTNTSSPSSVSLSGTGQANTAYLKLFWEGGGGFFTTNVSQWTTMYVVHSVSGGHSVANPSWNTCSGDVLVVETGLFSESHTIHPSECGFPCNTGLSLDPSTTSITVRLQGNLEGYSTFGLGGFWTNTDASGCSKHDFLFSSTSCETHERTVPSSCIYTSGRIEINVGYDDTNFFPGDDDPAGIKEVLFTFNGWNVLGASRVFTGKLQVVN